MEKFFVVMDIDNEKLEAVLSRLHDAEQTIRDCYDELREMGVVSLRHDNKVDAGSGN